jgi:hypothetical protein
MLIEYVGGRDADVLLRDEVSGGKLSPKYMRSRTLVWMT